MSMQITQLYRRGVVRPLNEAAERALRQFRIEVPVRTEWLPVLNDAHFTAIWDSSVLQRINQACGTHIDDYEEELLGADQLLHALQVIDALPNVHCARVNAFVASLREMMVDASQANQPLLFVL